MRRVIVVANKWWEVDPVLFVLLHDWCRPAEALSWPSLNRHPRPRSTRPFQEEPNPKPRAVFQISRGQVEIWCVSDLLEHLPSKYQSSSEKKAEQLPRIFEGSEPSLVIALGTAALPEPPSSNGCVVVGCQVFMHNFHPDGTNPHSNWSQGPFDSV